MRTAVLLLALVALPAAGAEFEGVITGKMFGKDAGTSPGTMKFSVAPAGVRWEFGGEETIPGKNGAPARKMSIQLTMLWRSAEPGVRYLINEQSKAYERKAIDKGERPETGEVKVQRLGKGTIAGQSVEHLQLTMASGRVEELWVAPSLGFPSAALALLGREGSNPEWYEAMKKAGVVGMPLKTTGSKEEGAGWEATSVERKSLPASVFAVPTGYHEAKNTMELMSPEQQQELHKMREDAMKNMTPEQRKQYEEMMKQYQQK